MTLITNPLWEMLGGPYRCCEDAIDEWSKAKRRAAWKGWVSNHTGYNLKWITGAVTKGIQFNFIWQGKHFELIFRQQRFHITNKILSKPILKASRAYFYMMTTAVLANTPCRNTVSIVSHD